MKKKSKNIFLLWGSIGSCLLFFGVLFSLAALYVANNVLGSHQQDATDTVVITREAPFMTEFTSQLNNLRSIAIMFNNPGYQNKDPMTFRLTDNDQVIREVAISGSNIGTNDTVKFQFLPIPDSADKAYHISLTSDATSQPIVVYTNKAGELTHKSYAKLSPIATLEATIIEVSQKLGDDPIFAALYGAILMSGGAGLVAVMKKRVY